MLPNCPEPTLMCA
jgi:hypothetical protein